MLEVKLNVRDEKEKKRFLKRLFFYRSFLFRWVKFEVDTDDAEVMSIVSALNIKSRKKRIEFVYDTACKMIDDKFKGLNICGFEGGKCHVQKLEGCKYINGCCRYCRYQSDKGCPTSNLACKLFFCSEVRERFEVIEFDDLNILKLLNVRMRTVVSSDYFSKREDVLGDLYTRSMTIATIRIWYRIFRDMIFHKIKKNARK